MHLTIQRLASNKTAICGQQSSGRLPTEQRPTPWPCRCRCKKAGAAHAAPYPPHLRGRKPAPHFPLCPVISPIRTIFPFTAVFHFLCARSSRPFGRSSRSQQLFISSVPGRLVQTDDLPVHSSFSFSSVPGHLVHSDVLPVHSSFSFSSVPGHLAHSDDLPVHSKLLSGKIRCFPGCAVLRRAAGMAGRGTAAAIAGTTAAAAALMAFPYLSGRNPDQARDQQHRDPVSKQS